MWDVDPEKWMKRICALMGEGDRAFSGTWGISSGANSSQSPCKAAVPDC